MQSSPQQYRLISAPASTLIDVAFITPQRNSLIVALLELIDVAFITLPRNSLVALLEAVCARIFFFGFVNIPEILFPFFSPCVQGL